VPTSVFPEAPLAETIEKWYSLWQKNEAAKLGITPRKTEPAAEVEEKFGLPEGFLQAKAPDNEYEEKPKQNG
jgi:hypothetical protein